MHVRIPVGPDLAPFVSEIVVQHPSSEPYVVLLGPFPVLGFSWTGGPYTIIPQATPAPSVGFSSRGNGKALRKAYSWYSF